MKTAIPMLLSFIFVGLAGAADPALTPAQQSILDAQQKLITKWAAKPLIVAAVKAQNEKGPLAGMSNATWAALQPGTPIVETFQKNPAALWLAKKTAARKGLIVEAFLNGAKGEKVAFLTKTTSYIHTGNAKFDVPMSGKAWQGAPEFDESVKAKTIQISTPVLDQGKPIGVLVVGVAAEKLGLK